MLWMCANGALWEEAKIGSSPLYNDLVEGWEKWNAKHTDANTKEILSPTDDSDYPHVKFFDNHINPPSVRKLYLKMLNPDPTKRITIAEIIAKGWVKNAECCQIDSYEEVTTIIDASKASSCSKNHSKITVRHNHLPPTTHRGHRLVRLPGSTDM
jgi:protein-serine/threonine kinase